MLTDLGRDVFLPPGDFADGGRQLRVVCVLENRALGSVSERMGDPVGRSERRQENHLGFRRFFGDFRSCRDAVFFRHHEVHDDDVGGELQGLLDGFDAVLDLTHDLQVPFRPEKGGESGPDNRVVVGDEDLDLADGLCHLSCLLWDVERYGRLRAFSRRTSEGELAFELVDALLDAEQPVVSLGEAGSRVRVEPASVVADGEEQPVAVDAAGDPNLRGAAVADAVQRQFADDAQDRVGRVVRDPLARDASRAG